MVAGFMIFQKALRGARVFLYNYFDVGLAPQF